MQKRTRIFLELLQETVADFPGGVSLMAEEMGKARSTLYGEISPTTIDAGRTHKLGVLDWSRILRRTGDLRSLHHFCRNHGVLSLPVPRPPTEMQHTDWLRHLSAVAGETGEAVAALATALSDENLSPDERRRCTGEAWEALTACAALWMALGGDNA